MDIEEKILCYLSEKTELPVYANVPNPRPEEFITVERVGGESNEFGTIDHPSVAIQTWAASRYVASLYARQVREFMHSMPAEVVDVMGCSCNTLTDFPDPDSKCARYQGLYDLTVS